ncbi:MAG TPA: cation:proton antiporter [Sporichthya sp.]|nr:cation:proton antiporter [Sporichthya sp.]
MSPSPALRARVPRSVLWLVGASLAAQLWGRLGEVDPHTVERVVTVALVVILFDGGLHIGRRRFRTVVVPVALVGVLGTVLTTAGVAALAHWGLDFAWYPALLLGAAAAPTDPAVVFAVLGNHEIPGRSGTLLEGESGANDPVGIALMTALIAAGTVSAGALGNALAEFGLQLAVGLVGGLAGALVLRPLTRRSPLLLLAGALALFALTAAAHGSGFLAVFVAGIALGDDLPAQVGPHSSTRPGARPERTLAALAGLGEVVAFIALGLTVDPDVLRRSDVWLPGLVLGVALAVAIRPLLVGACLGRVALSGREKAFVLWAGLKGAVPILLGVLMLAEPVPDADRLYGVVVVLVLFSVLVQGSTVGALVPRTGTVRE